MAENTDATGGSTEVTANAGESQNQSGSENQGRELENKLTELENKLKGYVSLESKVQQLEDDKRRASAEAMRWQSTYKGLQRQTTQKLQEAAQVQRQLMEAQHSSAQLAELRETVNLLATKMLDEDQAKDFALAQRELRIRQMEEAMRRQPQTPQPQAEVGYVEDPEVVKRQYLDYYFPGVEIDHNHPEIDWGDGAPNQQEALRRFTSSVSKLVSGKGQPQQQATAKSEAEQLLEQLRAERAEFDKIRNSAIEEAKNQARRETEDRLRRLGIDAGNTNVASESQRRIQTDLDELDESLLTKGDARSFERQQARQQYDQKLAEIRKKLISQMQ